MQVLMENTSFFVGQRHASNRSVNLISQKNITSLWLSILVANLIIPSDSMRILGDNFLTSDGIMGVSPGWDHVPSGNFTSLAIEHGRMAIEMVNVPIENGGSFQFVMSTCPRPGNPNFPIGPVGTTETSARPPLLESWSARVREALTVAPSACRKRPLPRRYLAPRRYLPPQVGYQGSRLRSMANSRFFQQSNN